MNFFQNLSVRAKLFSGILLIISIFLVMIFWQFSRLNKMDDKIVVLKKAENSTNAIKELSEINNAEKALLLEIIQTDESENLKTLYEEHLKSARRINSLYDSLVFDIQIIFPDRSNIGRIKTINNLDETRAAINNSLNPIFDNVNTIKKKQLEIGDVFLPEELINITLDTTASVTDTTEVEESPAIIPFEAMVIEGSDRSIQLQNLFKQYKLNNNKIIGQYAEINKILRKEFSDSEQITKEISASIKIYNTVFFLIAIGVGLLVIFFAARTITKPITELEQMVSHLAEGELPEHSKVLAKDEIGHMATALNALTDGLVKTSEFASEIGKGNFASAFVPLSSKDVLGNSLLEMRKSLQAANEEENKRKVEDKERNWTTEGLARFGEILRRHTENIGLLSKDIIQNLVKYLNANQGGIFILNDSDPEDIYLELMSAYAYNREKFIKKKIKPGEGLIGGVAIEKYTIYMTDLPEEYIEIESGLGGANPKSLLIVPLKLEEQILGVIEIASFNQFKKYEIELVERIAESIASTLSTAKINTRTAELLEQSRVQAQEMQEQEEEMRQNMEEMVAAQEDSLRREEELKREVEELENMRATLAEKDKNQRQRI